MLFLILPFAKYKARYFSLPFLLLSCAAVPETSRPKLIILTIEKDESLKDYELEITIDPKRRSNLYRLYLVSGRSPTMDIK